MAPKIKKGITTDQRQQKHVLFTKRRQGLFRKAAELCVTCNAQIAIVMLSEAGNPYAFGHPSADEILYHYLHGTDIITGDKHGYQTRELAETLESKQEYEQCRAEHEGNKSMDVKQWIEKSFEACQTVEELEALKESHMALLENIKKRYSESARGERVVGSKDGELELAHNSSAFPGQLTCGSTQEFDFDNVGKARDHNFMSASTSGGVSDRSRVVGSKDDELKLAHNLSAFPAQLTCDSTQEFDFDNIGKAGNHNFMSASPNGGVGDHNSVMGSKDSELKLAHNPAAFPGQLNCESTQDFGLDDAEKAGVHNFMSASSNGTGVGDQNCVGFLPMSMNNPSDGMSFLTFGGNENNRDCDGFDRFGMQYANEDLYDIVRKARSCKRDSVLAVDSTGGTGGSDRASYVDFQQHPQPPLLSININHVMDGAGSQYIHKYDLANHHHHPQSEGLYSDVGCFAWNAWSNSSDKPGGSLMEAGQSLL